MSILQSVVYIVNADNIIVEVAENWAGFALENEGLALSAADVLGRDLLDFVSGKVTMSYWQGQLDWVRHGNQARVIHYRCDAQLQKRWMRVELCPEAGGNVRFIHQLVAAEQRAYPVYFVSARHRSLLSHIRCSLCNRIKIKGHWLEVDALREQNLACSADTYLVTYGLCASCVENNGLAEMRAALKK